MARAGGDEITGTPRREVCCVLFDLDNTLVPFFPALHAWAATWSAHLAPRASRGRVADDLLSNTFRAGEDLGGAMAFTARHWGLDVALVTDAAERAHRAYLDALRPYAGVQSLLEGLQREGLLMAVVTDAPGRRARERLEAAGLSDHFGIVITRDMSPNGKRGPEPFHMALEHLGAAPEETAMIGDYPAIDASWPNRLGMLSVLAGWGFHEHNAPRTHWERPWAVARHPGQVPALLADPTRPRPERPLNEWV